MFCENIVIANFTKTVFLGKVRNGLVVLFLPCTFLEMGEKIGRRIIDLDGTVQLTDGLRIRVHRFVLVVGGDVWGTAARFLAGDPRVPVSNVRAVEFPEVDKGDGGNGVAVSVWGT
jgi:hypothetical protein